MYQKNRNARRRPKYQTNYSTELAQRIAAEPTWVKVAFVLMWAPLGWCMGVMV